MEKTDLMKILGRAKDWNGDVPFDLAVKAITTMQEVIRCRDCKHYNPLYPNLPFDCDKGLIDTYGDDFCSRAERKEEP